MQTEISTYEQTAIDFLAQTNTKFKTEFVEFGKHFPNDTDSRNIFKCTLSNEKHSYSFRFGSSLADSCKEVKRAKILSTEKVTIYYGFSHTRAKVTFGHSIETTYPILLAISKGEKDLEVLTNGFGIENDFGRYMAQVATYNKANKHSQIQNPAKLDEIEAKVRGRIREAIKEAQETNENVMTGQADEIIYPGAYDILACIEKYPVYDFADFCSNYGYEEDSRAAYKAALREELWPAPHSGSSAGLWA